MLRCAILDDYLDVAKDMADWSRLEDHVEIVTFTQPFAAMEVAAAALQDFDIVCAMRERTPFPRALFDALPLLKLLITSGMRNAAIDGAAARERGVVYCGTQAGGNPTAALAIALMLELTRRVGIENARMKAGAPLQTTLGIEVEGKTLGIVGLGKLGSKVARIGQALGMNVIAWSENLTPDKCAAVGATYASKNELFAQADVVSIHLVLSSRTRGLVGATDLARMKPSAFLVNTARGPIVDEDALLAALRDKRIAGAGIDVSATEPLPVDHPFRTLDNIVVTPHLGYVTQESFRAHYGQMVEAILAWLDGTPVRVLE